MALARLVKSTSLITFPLTSVVNLIDGLAVKARAAANVLRALAFNSVDIL